MTGIRLCELAAPYRCQEFSVVLCDRISERSFRRRLCAPAGSGEDGARGGGSERHDRRIGMGRLSR